MTVDLWFPLAVYYDDLAAAAAHRDACVAAVYEAYERSPERGDAAWTGDVHGEDWIHEDPRFGWLTSAVAEHAWIYLAGLGHDLDELELYVQRCWPVVSAPGQWVAGHAHHTAHLSAVYYLSAAPDSGALRFANASRPNELSPGAGAGATGAYREWNALNFGASDYAPIEGRLVLFPSKQRHEVLRNESAVDRVSISFDLVISTRSGRPGGRHEFLTPPPDRWRRMPRPERDGIVEVRADGPMDLAALARRANDLDVWTLPSVETHPLWVPAIYPHCSNDEDWWAHSEATSESGGLPAARAITPDSANWTTYRGAVDRVHDHLVGAGVSTYGATATPASVMVQPDDVPEPARCHAHLAVYLRLDEADSRCAIEFGDDSDAITLAPRALAIVSGFRRQRVVGAGATVLRFGIDVPSMARPGRPDRSCADDRTALLGAVALPLAAPRPDPTTVEAMLARTKAVGRRDRQRARCTVSHKYLVDAADPAGITDDERQVIRSHGRTDDAVVERLTDVVHRTALLDERQCQDLIAYARRRLTAIVPDTVDGRPEYQVDLDVEQLADVVGPAAVERLLALPRCQGGIDRTPDWAAGASLFVRAFSPETRRHIAFHTDVSSWTTNVPLDAPDDASGGRLLMLYGGALHDERRVQGEALSHRNDVVHGVSRVVRGERWSLIALFPATDDIRDDTDPDTTTDHHHHEIYEIHETKEITCPSAT